MDQIQNNLEEYLTNEVNDIKFTANSDQNGINGETRTCAVVGCQESKNIEHHLFFKFPEDSSARQVWTNLTGRCNWTPDSESYICVVHFSVDSFTCDESNKMVLLNEAIPSLKLPGHVLEVEYIEEDTSENDDDDDGTYPMDTDYEMYDSTQLNGSTELPHKLYKPHPSCEVKIELLKLFTQVQKMQRQAVRLKDKLKCNSKIYNKRKKYIKMLNEIIASKEDLLKNKVNKKIEVDLPLLEKIQEERNDMIISMPTRQTDDLKNFALSVYKYSPQAYIYIRNSLRTMLPSSQVLEGWVNSGYQPKNLLTNSNLIKVIAEQTETELCCKISLH